jgi:nucleoid-associated protein YgaU
MTKHCTLSLKRGFWVLASLALSSCATSSSSTESPATEGGELSIDNPSLNASNNAISGDGLDDATANLDDATANLDDATANLGASPSNASGNAALNTFGNSANLNALNQSTPTGGLNLANGGEFDPDAFSKKNSAPTNSFPTNSTLAANSTSVTNPTQTSSNAVVTTNIAPPNNALPSVQNSSDAETSVANSNSQNTASIPSPTTHTKPQKQKFSAALTPQELAYWKAAAGKLKELAPEDTPKDYEVQHGDTLWDIADQLLDDHSWWPKIWTYNTEIANPNIIQPGQKLVFQPGIADQAPLLAIENMEKATPVSSNNLFITKIPIGTEHPWSDKTGLLIDIRELGTDTDLAVYGANATPQSYPIMIPGFLSSSSPDSVGHIIKVGDGRIMSVNGQTTYASLSQNTRPGERFLSVRKIEGATDSNDKSPFTPDLYMYTGVLGVVKVHKSGHAAMVVEDTTVGVLEDDIVIPFKNIHQVFDPTTSGPVANLKAKVLAIAGLTKVLGSSGQVVFLERNEGSASPGDTIELFMPAGGTLGFEESELDGTLAAQAKVIDVNSDSIAAVITNSIREVSIGARTWNEF